MILSDYVRPGVNTPSHWWGNVNGDIVSSSTITSHPVRYGKCTVYVILYCIVYETHMCCDLIRHPSVLYTCWSCAGSKGAGESHMQTNSFTLRFTPTGCGRRVEHLEETHPRTGRTFTFWYTPASCCLTNYGCLCFIGLFNDIEILAYYQSLVQSEQGNKNIKKLKYSIRANRGTSVEHVR